MTDAKQLNLRKMQEFCRNDIKIKEYLYSLAPDKKFLGNEEYNIELSDKMFEGLKEIKYYLQKTMSDFELDSYGKHLDQLFHSYETQLIEAGTDSKKLELFYKNNLSNMRPEIVQETGKTCVGYTSRDTEIFDLVQKTRTINEFLHVIHSKIINDEKIYSNLPEISREMSQEDYPCVLYGINSQVSNVVLNSVAAVKDIGWTDIMSLSEDQMIMMVRDKGHALTIQINQNEDDTFNVKYYIPKLCNKEMINNLKGVIPVNENSNYTVGSFDTTKEELGIDLLHFITNVPTDLNMNWGNEDRTEYSDLFKIIENMDYPHLAKVAKFNPILYQADGFDTYLKERYINDLSITQDKINEEVKNGAPVSEIKELSNKIKAIKDAGKEIGINDNKNNNLDY